MVTMRIGSVEKTAGTTPTDADIAHAIVAT
jgi:hypothetical protein